MLRLGDTPIVGLYLGDKEIKKAFLGSNLVFQESAPLVVSTILNENSWETISAVAKSGQARNYWNIGDTKTIILNGKIGNTSFSNYSIDAFIIGFDHNDSIEGKNRIHFQIGKKSGKKLALVDSKYNSYSTTSGYFNMNKSNTNAGGWAGSTMRSTLLGNSSTPSSPRANSALAALPADLRAVIQPTTKYSYNASSVSASTDYLFLLSEFEYFGASKYGYTDEQNYQKQYEYYTSSANRISYKHNATGTACNAWTRSKTRSGSTNFVEVFSSGVAMAIEAYYSYGLTFGFTV